MGLFRRRGIGAVALVTFSSMALFCLAAMGPSEDADSTRHGPKRAVLHVRPESGNGVRLDLLGAFRLSHGGVPVTMPRGSKHLLAFVALRGQAVDRAVVAGTLWPDVTDKRAFGNLRAALARLDPVSRQALDVGTTDLDLAAGVDVDVRKARAAGVRLFDRASPPIGPTGTAGAIASLSLDLLPGWYDEWALDASEDWRQFRLHALEMLAARLTVAGRYAEAATAAFAAVRTDPLRESTRSVLIHVHLAEGNRSEAIREYGRFRQLLRTELGVDPSPRLSALVETGSAGVTRS